jgi:hypothetical protein
MSELLLAALTFAFVTSVTPGPNNVMLTASGANFGMVRTIPHIVGITVGVVVMIYAVGLGAAQLLQRHPPLHQAMKLVGAVYLLWLAWAIARAGQPGEAKDRPARPMTLLQAALFPMGESQGLDHDRRRAAGLHHGGRRPRRRAFADRLRLRRHLSAELHLVVRLRHGDRAPAFDGARLGLVQRHHGGAAGRLGRHDLRLRLGSNWRKFRVGGRRCRARLACLATQRS